MSEEIHTTHCTLIEPSSLFPTVQTPMECTQSWTHYLRYIHQWLPPHLRRSPDWLGTQSEHRYTLLVAIQQTKRSYASYWWLEHLWLLKIRIQQGITKLLNLIFGTPESLAESVWAVITSVSVVYTLIPLFIGTFFADQRITAMPGIQLLGHYMEFSEVWSGLAILWAASLFIRRSILKVHFHHLLIAVFIAFAIQTVMISAAHGI